MRAVRKVLAQKFAKIELHLVSIIIFVGSRQSNIFHANDISCGFTCYLFAMRHDSIAFIYFNIHYRKWYLSMSELSYPYNIWFSIYKLRFNIYVQYFRASSLKTVYFSPQFMSATGTKSNNTWSNNQ